MIDLTKYQRLINWLIDQRDKAKAAWGIVVFLAGLLGYQNVVQFQNIQKLQDQCPNCEKLDTAEQLSQ